jgi:hypothetical protein
MESTRNTRAIVSAMVELEVEDFKSAVDFSMTIPTTHVSICD